MFYFTLNTKLGRNEHDCFNVWLAGEHVSVYTIRFGLSQGHQTLVKKICSILGREKATAACIPRQSHIKASSLMPFCIEFDIR